MINKLAFTIPNGETPLQVNPGNVPIDGSLGAITQYLITFLFVIAAIAALFFLIYGGIKWMTSGGDKAGVEAARNTIMYAVIGLIIVFLSFFIVRTVGLLFGVNLFP